MIIDTRTQKDTAEALRITKTLGSMAQARISSSVRLYGSWVDDERNDVFPGISGLQLVKMGRASNNAAMTVYAMVDGEALRLRSLDGAFVRFVLE